MIILILGFLFGLLYYALSRTTNGPDMDGYMKTDWIEIFCWYENLNDYVTDFEGYLKCIEQNKEAN